jgi:hypothetical protein
MRVLCCLDPAALAGKTRLFETGKRVTGGAQSEPAMRHRHSACLRPWTPAVCPLIAALLQTAVPDCVVVNVTYDADAVSTGCQIGDVVLSSAHSYNNTNVSDATPCNIYCPGAFIQSGTQPSCLGMRFFPAKNDPITCVERATCGDADGEGAGVAPVTNADCGAGYYASGDDSSLCLGIFCTMVRLDDLAACCRPCARVPRASASASYTCTSSSDSRVSGCADGSYKIPGPAGQPDLCESCAPIAYHAVDAKLLCEDGEVSWLEQSSPYAPRCAFGYYVENTGQISTGGSGRSGVRCSPGCSGVGQLVAGGGFDGSVGSGTSSDRLNQPRYMVSQRFRLGHV